MLFLLTMLQVCSAYDYSDIKSLYSYRREFSEPNYNETFFTALESYQVNASPVPQGRYPWIARVVHSTQADVPHVCTASCVHDGLFITAASCIIGLKVRYTTILYQAHRLSVRAFVIPSNGTKQAFDDIAFIVVQETDVPWSVVKLFHERNRTDAMFQWFEDISLKVRYTTILYQAHRLSVRAFVIPSNGTKQAFDDIAFIVVQQTDVPWSVVKLFHEKNRTDAVFQWFEDMGASEYKVVGYATKKGIHRIKSADRVYNLTELKVFIGLEICATILTFQKKASVGFNIPCYHSCTLKEFQQANKTGKCSNYHGVDGGAVFDVKNGHLLGVATWGAYFSKYELPVGFAVVNSANFYADYECAKIIWADSMPEIKDGYYQKLCDRNSI